MAAPTSSPCSREATTWRECLKKQDYGPDLELKECDKPRVAYYACINNWRQSENSLSGRPKAAATPESFYGPPQCAEANDSLQRCMQIYMFEVSNCRKEMDQLKVCVTTHDPRAQMYHPKADKDAAAGAAQQSWWSKLFARK